MINNNTWRGKTIRFMSAQTISLFGSALVQYAIIWHITLSTSSGAMMTISTLCGFVPQMLISLFAGVWIDRYNRKYMIMLADAAIAIATLIAALIFLSGNRSVWVLFAVLVVRSAGTGLQAPAVNALIPQIVPTEHLMRVNGINSTINAMMMFLAPAASGAILSVMPIETTFIIDVATAVLGISITMTIAVPPLERRAEAGSGQFEEIRLGFAYVRENSFVSRLLLFQITVMILISPSAFLTPLMVSRSFGAEVWRLTASEMTFSAGAMAGGLLISIWGGFKSRMKTTAAAGVAYGALMLGLGLAPAFVPYLVFNFLIGVTMPYYSAPITVALQERVPANMHGRVFSFVQIAGSCALPLGMTIFGPMADAVKIQFILLGAGTVVVLYSLNFLRSVKSMDPPIPEAGQTESGE